MSSGFEWLDWLEPSGPFLAAPVLNREFPQGLDTLDPNKRRVLRQAYDEYRQALDDEDLEARKFHTAWIDLVLKKGLEYDEDDSGDNLKTAVDLPVGLVTKVAEHGVILKPDYAVVDDQDADKPMMLIQVYGQDVDLCDAVRGDGWASSPRERMVRLCRDTGTRLGLITNGEHWLFVDAPVGSISSFASWYARLWGPEPVLLQVFVGLLGIRRFFVAEDEQLPALIDKSVDFQDDVTAALGEQVRRAVEVLIQALDKADVDRNRELLQDVDPRELYEAGLTVMMRLVFLLSAEERELLLLGDERYEANYAVSTLRMQLRGEDDAILQRRWDAWSRLLAIFRAIYGGIEHENLRMPALGGSLFDPDRFPFLEGRDKGSSWTTDPAKPLPIDNQTVLLILDAIQLFEGRTLSYRGLDIEQLGYVYEGLLDHTVKRAKEVTLELDATKSAKQPWVLLGELESSRLDGESALEELLRTRSGSSISRVRNDLNREMKPPQSISLLTACHNDQALHDQLAQFFHLIRTDSWGRPMVYPKGSFMVTTGKDRRETGSHYTPTSLTEAIVKETLEPAVYVGPAKGKQREEWQLKTPEELLDLKICDPAMGSGAFLVQACRWLGERVVESWAQAEDAGKFVDISGAVSDSGKDSEPMPSEPEERVVNARRLIAERCIYGVDLNPLAVELAKLSVWLVTLAKGRPFGFLDHNLKCGDSLLGIHHLDQLTGLSLNPDGTRQTRLFGRKIRAAVEEAIVLRRELRATPIRDIHDVNTMASLDAQSQTLLELPEYIANAFFASVYAADDRHELEQRISSLAVMSDQAVQSNAESVEAISKRASNELRGNGLLTGQRRPFHWPLEFPEVFSRGESGFDALVGNPPFLGGRKIRGTLGGNYLNYLLKSFVENASGNADLCAYFLLRAFQICSKTGAWGLLATNTISEGDTRQTGLQNLVAKGSKIYRAVRNHIWPGTAAITVTIVHMMKQQSAIPCVLDNQVVSKITPSLKDLSIAENAKPLSANKSLCYQGSVLAAKGFILTVEEAEDLLEADSHNSDVIFVYYTGSEIFNQPVLKPTRMVINFHDWALEKARQYAGPMVIVEQKVRPIREKVRRKAHREKWWQYGDKRPALYKILETLDRTLVQTRHTKYLCPQFVPTGAVFSDSVVIFPTNSYFVFGVLNSTFHDLWARETSGSIRTELRYSHTDCLYSFPMPMIDDQTDVEHAASALDKLREQLRVSRDVSINGLLDLLHDPNNRDKEILRLRLATVELDKRVSDAYGWKDLNLDHEFVDLGDRTRFTVCQKTRREILTRLLEMNNERYTLETSAAKVGPEGAVRKPRRSRESLAGTLELFEAAERKKD